MSKSKIPPDHQLYLRRRPFAFRCAVAIFPDDELQALIEYGNWLEALASGAIQPVTALQSEYSLWWRKPEAEVIRTHPLSRFAWRFSLEFLIRRRVSQGRGGLDGAGLAKWDASMATFGSTDVSS